MFFDSPIYIVFLAAVVLLYWRLGRVGQNRMLLAASYFFYGWWDWRFLGLIAISTVVDFFCARAIARSKASAQRRFLLAAAVAVNLTFLGFFKYFNFLNFNFFTFITHIINSLKYNSNSKLLFN